MSQTLISIIVPVYNCAPFLDECVNSILKQTYPHFELILINDGSTDNSLEIITRYEKLDRRTNVITKENSGVSNTRNLGISLAKGDYICFIDADDWVESDYLSSFLKYAENDKLIIQHIKRGSSIVGNFKYGIYHTKTDYNKLFLNNQLLYHGGPVSKHFSRNIIIQNKILFNPKLSYGEDLMFFLHYLDGVDEVEIIDSCGYNYRYNSNSLSTKKHTFDSLFSFFREINAFFTHKNIKENNFKKYIFSSISDVAETSIDHGIIDENNINNRKENLNTLRKELNINYLKFTKPYRKVTYILLKTKQYKLLIYLRKRVNALKRKSH